MRRVPIFILAATMVAAAAVSSRASDWPRFRGPEGNGHSDAKSLPVEWDTKKNVVWKKALPGKAWSSPVLAGGRLYLTNAVADQGRGDDPAVNRSLRALCMDAGNGKIIWDKEVFSQNGKTAPKIHSKNSHASPTPVVEGNRLYVHFGHQGIACLDLNGNTIWKNRDINYSPVHGNGGSPLIVDDKLFFSCDAASDPFVVALYKATGKVAWRKPRKSDANKKFSFSTAALNIDSRGRKEIISPGSNVVVAYDPKDGSELWSCKYDGYSVIPKPVIGHGMVFVGTGYDRATLLGIKLGGRGDVTGSHLKWEIKKRMPHTPAPLLIGDEIYTISDSGMFSCIDAKSGKVHWQERSGGDGFSSAPIFADGKIYIQDERGLGIVIKPDKKELKVLARNDLDERCLASYAVTDGSLFIRTEKHLYRIGKKNG